VKTNKTTTIGQTFARLFITFIVTESHEKVKKSKWITSIFLKINLKINFPGLSLSWSISDFIRYLFYFCKLINYQPRIIKWLRYNLFLILYPIGMVSDLMLIYTAFRSQIRIQSQKVEENITEPIIPISKPKLYSMGVFLLFNIFYGYPSIYKYMLDQRMKKFK
jgi:very-long-chain (3R)-3-hydroxyacyl-CoA dehydratase